jgi:hypothetical protein
MKVPNSLYELSLWDALASVKRQKVADGIAEQLPAPWEFVGFEMHSLGNAIHEIAFFDFAEAKFALIPGSRKVMLGYDRKRKWSPGSEYQADLEAFEKEYWSLKQALNSSLSGLRTCWIAPLLVEVDCHEFAWDDATKKLAERVSYTKIIERRITPFRLLTSDEWEYVCAAGTRTLFRWGDELPPIACTWPGAETDWTLHRQPNAFGLQMIADTYQYEQCAGGRIRGGDGGCTVCGSYSEMTNWLPLATAALLPKSEHADWENEGLVRRVWPLE